MDSVPLIKGNSAVGATEDAIRGASETVTRVARALALIGPSVRSEDDALVWEAYALIAGIGLNLRLARGLHAAQSDFAERYLGSALDAGVFERGLLYGAIELCIRAGIVESNEDVDYLEAGLDSSGLAKVPIVVAYIDYLGTEDLAPEIGEDFARLGRRLGPLVSLLRQVYYWRSSDTYYLFLILGQDSAAHIRSLVRTLVQVQQNVRLDPRHRGWHWQIGVSLAQAQVIGDIVLPTTGTHRAAKLMQKAHRPRRGGGLILCDGGLCDGTGFGHLQDLLDADGSLPEYCIGRRKDLVYEIAESRNRGVSWLGRRLSCLARVPDQMRSIVRRRLAVLIDQIR